MGNVQTKMLQILSDGLPHTPGELHTCLYDELGRRSNIKHHVCMLRKHLQPQGKDILGQVIKRKWHYRLVKLLSKMPVK